MSDHSETIAELDAELASLRSAHAATEKELEEARKDADFFRKKFDKLENDCVSGKDWNALLLEIAKLEPDDEMPTDETELETFDPWDLLRRRTPVLLAAEAALASERDAHEETKRTLAEEQKSHLDALSEAFAMSGAERARASALAARVERLHRAVRWVLDSMLYTPPPFREGKTERWIDYLRGQLAEDDAALARPAAGATTEHDGEEGK